MAVYEVVCSGCGETFEAKSPRARWCTPGCKKRQQRKPDPKPEASSIEPVGGLYDAVLRDLEAAGRVNTVDGQLALELARDLRVSTSKATLSRELRAVLAKALEGAAPDSGSGSGEPSEEEQLENEIEARRRRRDAKIRKAASSA